MMRALRLFSVGFVFLLCLATSQAAQAQMETYELGPYTVQGEGFLPNEAIADAWAEVELTKQVVQAGLPPNHVVLTHDVITQGFVDPNTYEIKFVLIIWDQSPPGPPAG